MANSTWWYIIAFGAGLTIGRAQLLYWLLWTESGKLVTGIGKEKLKAELRERLSALERQNYGLPTLPTGRDRRKKVEILGELAIEKYYETYVGKCYYCYYEFNTPTIPWVIDRVIDWFVSTIESKTAENNGRMIRLKVYKDLYWWGPIPYWNFKLEWWYASITPQLLIEPFTLIAIIVAIIATIFLIREIGRMGKEEVIAQFICPICKAVFATASAYDAHMCQVHGICKYTCPYCGASFDTSEELQKHIAEMHKPGPGIADILMWIAVIAGIGIIGTVVVPFIREAIKK